MLQRVEGGEPGLALGDGLDVGAERPARARFRLKQQHCAAANHCAVAGFEDQALAPAL
ncbi:hypothetical protein D9M68_983890 [compost metagenome]